MTTGDSLAVSIDLAAASDAGALANLMHLYMHDMSEIFPVEPGADGRFVYDRLPSYWTEPERRFPFAIRAGGQLAGFALVTRGIEAPGVLDVAEFFVLRGHRRGGVGRAAALALWRRLPGRWLVRVAEANRAGVPFWRATVSEYTRGAFSEASRPGTPSAWRVFSFESGR